MRFGDGVKVREDYMDHHTTLQWTQTVKGATSGCGPRTRREASRMFNILDPDSVEDFVR